ncbi:MAG: methyltransferase domain-containing protein [Anaerolineae bacterium]|nr:methyltransferase domain-containing protein [Anaerolineae bacterium]MCB0205302.1 methyltransferase domain-containing protein [Anaerolineae bacterium]MCB0253330.1 methyltransferase domain-containing protein [Anaerolineae bacterium]
MRLRCPDCRRPFEIDDQTWPQAAGVACPGGHSFPVRDGVLELLDTDLARRLADFLTPFSAIRENDDKRLTDPAAYPLLPDGPAVQGNHEWRLRRYDLEVISQLLAGRSRQRILDFGAWNGWLSNRLAKQGHHVTAIDYFVDEFDGLRARKFHDSDWLAVQMNLEDLDVLDEQYDMLIVNRCVQFYTDPPAFAETVKPKIAPGGCAVLTGLAFLRDPSHRIAGLTALRRQYQDHGFDFFKPMKGYLDFDDKARLQRQGWRLTAHRQLLTANARSLLSPTAPRYYYAVWQAGQGRP